MAANKKDDYMAYIMKHPKFQSEGRLDETGFYFQLDKSIRIT
jgi:hypothetical protein